MIRGIGCDLISVDRIARAHERHGARFLDRVYSATEQHYCLAFRHPGERLAARWAAKEAALKALGTGIAHGARLVDVTVDHDEHGAPILHLAGAPHDRARAMGVARLWLSLSHADGMAMATVVLEGTDPA